MQDGWITDRALGKRFPAYTRGNAADVLPDPVTPLGWTFVWNPAILPGARDGFIDFGLVDWNEFDTPKDPETFCMRGGYFFNPLSLVRLMGARMPGASPEAIDKAYFDERPGIPPYVREPWHDSEKHAQKLTASMGWVMTTESFPNVDAEKVLADRLRAERPPFDTLWDAALLARARSMVPYLQQMFDTSIWASLGASAGPGAIAAICEALGDPSLTIRLLAGVEVDSAKPSFAMWDLSRRVRNSAPLTALFDAGVGGLHLRLRTAEHADAVAFCAAFHAFLFDYGSRGPREWDLGASVWETDPDLALAAIDRIRLAADDQSPVLRHDAAVAERDRVAVEVRAKLAGDPDTLATFDLAMRSASIFLAGRERYKTNMIKVIGEIRMCLLEFGRRAAERGQLDRPEQIYMLLADELDHFRFEPQDFIEIVRQREREYRELFELEPPIVIQEPVPPLSQWARRSDRGLAPVSAGTVLQGAAGSGGVATGRARVILDPSDPGALEPGDVLVAPSTDPSWTPLFMPAAAVVVGVGAMGSHAMIVSRELGIPCVASVADATLRIPDGATVTVDGNMGTVTVVSL